MIAAADGVHAFHDGLQGFDERTVLYDHCPTCEARAALPGLGVFDYLDEDNVRTLRNRAEYVARRGLLPEWTSDCDRKVVELILTLSDLMYSWGAADAQRDFGHLRRR